MAALAPRGARNDVLVARAERAKTVAGGEPRGQAGGVPLIIDHVNVVCA
jgi:hypothetical protein